MSTGGESIGKTSGKQDVQQRRRRKEHHHLLGSPSVDQEVVPLKPAYNVLHQYPCSAQQSESLESFCRKQTSGLCLKSPEGGGPGLSPWKPPHCSSQVLTDWGLFVRRSRVDPLRSNVPSLDGRGGSHGLVGQSDGDGEDLQQVRMAK